jgi:hypothetical protein
LRTNVIARGQGQRFAVPKRRMVSRMIAGIFFDNLSSMLFFSNLLK